MTWQNAIGGVRDLPWVASKCAGAAGGRSDDMRARAIGAAGRMSAGWPTHWGGIAGGAGAARRVSAAAATARLTRPSVPVTAGSMRRALGVAPLGVAPEFQRSISSQLE